MASRRAKTWGSDSHVDRYQRPNLGVKGKIHDMKHQKYEATNDSEDETIFDYFAASQESPTSHVSSSDRYDSKENRLQMLLNANETGDDDTNFDYFGASQEDSPVSCTTTTDRYNSKSSSYYGDDDNDSDECSTASHFHSGNNARRNNVPKLNLSLNLIDEEASDSQEGGRRNIYVESRDEDDGVFEFHDWNEKKTSTRQCSGSSSGSSSRSQSGSKSTQKRIHYSISRSSPSPHTSHDEDDDTTISFSTASSMSFKSGKKKCKLNRNGMNTPHNMKDPLSGCVSSKDFYKYCDKENTPQQMDSYIKNNKQNVQPLSVRKSSSFSSSRSRNQTPKTPLGRNYMYENVSTKNTSNNPSHEHSKITVSKDGIETETNLKNLRLHRNSSSRELRTPRRNVLEKNASTENDTINPKTSYLHNHIPDVRVTGAASAKASDSTVFQLSPRSMLDSTEKPMFPDPQISTEKSNCEEPEKYITNFSHELSSSKSFGSTVSKHFENVSYSCRQHLVTLLDTGILGVQTRTVKDFYTLIDTVDELSKSKNNALTKTSHYEEKINILEANVTELKDKLEHEKQESQQAKENMLKQIGYLKKDLSEKENISRNGKKYDESKIIELQRMLKEAHLDNLTLIDAHDTKQSECNEVIKSLEEALKAQVSYQEELKRAKSSSEDESKAKRLSLEKELSSLRSENETLKKQLQESESRYSEGMPLLQQENQKLNSRLLEADLKIMKVKDLEKIVMKYEEIQKDLEEMNAQQKRESEKEIEKLNRIIRDESDHSSKKKGELQEMHSKFLASESKRNDFEHQVVILKSEKNSKIERIEKLEQEISIKDKLTENLNLQLRNTQAKLIEKENMLEKERCVYLQNEYILKSELVKIQKQFRSNETSIKDSADRLDRISQGTLNGLGIQSPGLKRTNHKKSSHVQSSNSPVESNVAGDGFIQAGLQALTEHEDDMDDDRSYSVSANSSFTGSDSDSCCSEDDIQIENVLSTVTMEDIEGLDSGNKRTHDEESSTPDIKLQSNGLATPSPRKVVSSDVQKKLDSIPTYLAMRSKNEPQHLKDVVRLKQSDPEAYEFWVKAARTELDTMMQNGTNNNTQESEI